MSAFAPLALLIIALTTLLRLTVDGVGAILAIVSWRRAPAAAVLALVGFSVAAILHVVNLVWQLVVLDAPVLITGHKLSLATFRVLSDGVFLIESVAGAAVWALLFWAVFADRPHLPARR